MKSIPRAELMARQKRLMDKTLKKVGYLDMKQREVKPKRPDFPDLKVSQTVPPTSDSVTYTETRPPASQHPDAQVFPVGHLHKQGTVLITSTKPEDLQWYGGKKS